ncbi:MAG: glycosyltransferase family 4 protein [Bacteroidales bacterium]|jgi:glycosyltransferase involved in cell wall biosynthesis|nr:glycosyltransferase family 4 protein [Bacteroidales bacterium]
MIKIAIVVQRYGPEINGGAETLARNIAERLSEKYEVEVLTSCSLHYDPFRDHYPAGSKKINGVTVRRFAVAMIRTSENFMPLDLEMQSNHDVSDELAEKWMDGLGPYCPKLIDYINKHNAKYDVFILFTYLYYTTVRSMPLVAKKAILVPTAHDEQPIYYKIFRAVFLSPRGIMYNTEAERSLVIRLFRNQSILYDIAGVGVDVPDNIDTDRFLNAYNISNDYLVYVGRIENHKGCDELFKYFIEYKKRNHNYLKLVLMGRSIIDIPNHPDIISLGFVSDKDKFDGIAASKLLVLPSQYESLSISVLEAMKLSIPVIVNGKCDVLNNHCVKSNGGLYYNNYFEFEGCVNYLISNKEVYRAMKNNAKKYVDNNYHWDIIMKKYDKMIKEITQEQKE